MFYDKWPDALSKCRLFKGIEPNEREIMLECFRPKVFRYGKNDMICIEGEIFTGIGIMLSGTATIAKENSSGNRMIMDMLEPGDMFGEMAAFSGNGVWPAMVTAQSPSSVIYMPANMIIGQCSKLCPSHRILVVNMLEVISKKALMLNKKLEYLVVKSLRGKIVSFLLEQYKRIGSTAFTMPMKRNELAEFLNVSRPSLSREMCKMRAEGLIDFYRSSLKILDIEALKAEM
jgi:CRP/FNR family transcriptional regulator, dissimilatory nitrate respiration regulator